mgnify:CR=1 FL=1
MARFKDFGNPSESVTKEKLSFKLYDEEFECIPALPGKTLLDFAAISASEDGGESAKAITGFFEKVLLPESYERFEKLAEDPDRIVSVETLAKIIEFLIEELTDRPTQGSEPS